MIHSGAVDAAWWVTGFLIAGWFYFLALRPFNAFITEIKSRWSALLIATLALIVLWHIRATVLQGLSLHLIGATLCTLVFAH
jgi:uncharacterized membrane protein